MPNIVLLSYWGGRMLDYIGAEIYVDNEGRRFVDETTTTARIAQAILKLPGHSMYVITDARIGRRALTSAPRSQPAVSDFQIPLQKWRAE